MFSGKKSYDYSKSPNYILEIVMPAKKKRFCIDEDDNNIIKRAFKVPKPATLGNQLLQFYKREKLTDVVIHVDGVEIKAHKFLLAVSSPVFSAMFDNQTMKEAEENRIVIEDAESEVIKQMLEYVYTHEKPKHIKKFPEKLLLVANKYQMDHLKNMCERALAESLTVTNAVLMLELTDLLQLNVLKCFIIKYIGKHAKICDSSEFKDLENRNLQLTNEVFRILLLE